MISAAHDAETELGKLWCEVVRGDRVGHATGRRATIRVSPRSQAALRLAAGHAGVGRVMQGDPHTFVLEVPEEWEATAAEVLDWWAGVDPGDSGDISAA
jgi:hypothetical protein